MFPENGGIFLIMCDRVVDGTELEHETQTMDVGFQNEKAQKVCDLNEIWKSLLLHQRYNLSLSLNCLKFLSLFSFHF
jgi:hypothetical protein